MSTPLSPLKLKGKERDRFVIKSISITILTTAVLYLLVNWYWLQVLLSWTSYGVLKLFGFDVNLLTYAYGSEETSYGVFNIFIEYYRNFERSTPILNWNVGIAPALQAFYVTRPPTYFTIVKACTAMQAGALMFGLILATPAPRKQQLKAIGWTFIAVFIGNALRIALIIGMTVILVDEFGMVYAEGWMWSHDVLGKMISFLGTIIFTSIIEKQDVHVLDTITVWMDTILNKLGL